MPKWCIQSVDAGSLLGRTAATSPKALAIVRISTGSVAGAERVACVRTMVGKGARTLIELVIGDHMVVQFVKS
jgi:hypothetical protein